MKKVVCSVLAALLCLTVLAACSAPPLPEGVTEESLGKAATATIEQLNDCDYETLKASMDETMLKAIEEANFNASWDAERETLGAYKGEKSSQYTSQKGYAIAIVQAEYEQKTLTYTLSYNADLTLAGLFYK